MRWLIPPWLVLLGLLLISLLDRVDPSRVFPAPLHWVGVIVMLGGVWPALAGAKALRDAGTEIRAFADPINLVTTGPFAVTRNPIYLGFALILLGAAILAGPISTLIAPVGFVFIADRWYIPVEEHAAAAEFGEAYDAYRGQVRRWI